MLRTGKGLTEDILEKYARRLALRGKNTWVMDLKAMLPALGIDEAEGLLDAGVAAYLLNPLKSGYAYDGLAAEHLGLTIPSREDLLGKSSFGEAFDQKPGEALACGGYMARTACGAGPILLEKLRKQGMEELFLKIEMPLIYSLFHMEQAGIAVRREALAQYGEKLGERIGVLEQEIYGLSGETFNINSPKQLGVILFEKLKLPYGKKTKTGYSTSADILEKLAPEHPLVSKILEYRQLAKLKSTYADGLAAYIGPDGAHSREIQSDHNGHGADQQHGAEPSEHPGAHGAGTGDQKGVRSRRGIYFRGRGLFPDRASGAGPHVGGRPSDRGLP